MFRSRSFSPSSSQLADMRWISRQHFMDIKITNDFGQMPRKLIFDIFVFVLFQVSHTQNSIQLSKIAMASAFASVRKKKTLYAFLVK